MSRRIGQFFLFIGLVLLVIFFASDQNETLSWGYFISGGVLVVVGGFLMWRNREPGVESRRFRTYRKLRDRPKRVKKTRREEE